MTNAALKMAAPGELCAHSKKLMAFCQTTARSLKAMRQHIGVTHERMDGLLRDMLAQRLIWKQSNGMYKTCTNKLQFINEPAQAANSLLALADEAAPNSPFDSVGSELDAEEEADNLPYRIAAAKEADATATQSEDPEQEDITELDIEIAEQQLGTSFATAPEFEPATYELDTMAAEFEAEQERGDTHQIDNITAKQRAINYCQMLLSPNSTELRRCLDELQMDLAVIALQQERSA